MHKSVVTLLVLFGLGLWSSPALAVPVLESDRVLITQSGSTLSDLRIPEGSVQTQLSFFNIDVPFLPFFGTQTILLTEPGNPSVVSDGLEMVAGGHVVGGVPKQNLDFSIISDDDSGGGVPSNLVSGLVSGSTVHTLEENGTLQDVTSSLFGMDTPPVNVSIQSDIDLAPVPEPPTGLLLGAGGLLPFALAYLKGRRTKKQLGTM